MNTPRFLLSLGFAASLHASVPEHVPDFRAYVDGKPLELHEFPQGAFGLPEVAHPVDMELRTGFDVRWVTVRPLSAGIAASIAADHRSVSFRVGTIFQASCAHSAPVRVSPIPSE